MSKTAFCTLLVIGHVMVFGQGNKSYDLRLSTGTVSLPANFGTARSEKPAKSDYFNGSYYRYIQFFELPSAEQKQSLSKAGVEILSYLPDNTYIASIKKGTDLGKLGTPAIRSLHPVQSRHKMLKELQEALDHESFPGYATKGKKIGIMITYYENLDHDKVKSCLRRYEITEEDKPGKWFTVWVKRSKIEDLIALPFVASAELADDKPQPDNDEGRTNIRSNTISTDYAGGRKYNGQGVEIGIQDDGRIGPHIDYQGRIANQFMSTNSGDHGDHCSGTLMGAGNKDPLMKGMAWGANLHVYEASGYQGFSLITTHYGTLGIRIISTSYSDGCNAGYTTRARQLDMQNLSMPELLHVFSAGNNGTSNCNYGAGAGWGNVTGGHKHSKNSIAVANLTSLDAVNSSSSRGPAHDGRLKPEISAVGTNVYSTIDANDYINYTGTSMSCPAVAGLFGQLYQAYKALNGNNNPPSALMKAIAMNTADDVGNPGPDFIHGYGRANGLRAVETIEQGAYFTATVSNGSTNSHTLTIPAGVKRAKIMTYWHDYQAQVGASTALVNNLNTSLTDASSTVYNPLVLDATPIAATLNLNAAPGVDNLNNHEQITLVNPAAGNYTLNVNGFLVPMGPQQYFVTWLFEMDGYTLTYPIGGEGLKPLETETIRWNAVETSGTQTLEYTTNNGVNWTAINSSIAGSQRYYNWTVPNVLSGQCRVRISRGAFSAESDTNFSIISPPTNLQLAWACVDSVKLSWNPVSGATSYDVFKLGTMYMDSIGTTTATTIIIKNIPTSQAHWFSVRSRGPLNAVSRRAIAVEKKTGVKACPQLANDLVCSQILSPSETVSNCHNLSKVPVIVNLYNAGTNTLSGANMYYRLNNGPVMSDVFTGVITPSSNVTFTFASTIALSTAGNYTLRAWAKNNQDVEAANDSTFNKIAVVPGTLQTLPFYEDFEGFTLCSTVHNCFITCGLSNGFRNETNLTVDEHDWRTNSGPPPTAGTGPQTDYMPGTAAGKYVYLESTIPCSSMVARMLSPCIDLSSASAATLTFAYHMYGASMGSLDVDIFRKGAWTNAIWSASGDHGNSWFTASIDLTPWLKDTVTFRWRGKTAGGLSDMAIDAINILEAIPVGLARTGTGHQGFSVFPNPGTDEFNVKVHSGTVNELAYTVTDVSGRIVLSGRSDVKNGDASARISLKSFAAGVYTLKLSCDGKVEYAKLYKV